MVRGFVKTQSWLTVQQRNLSVRACREHGQHLDKLDVTLSLNLNLAQGIFHRCQFEPVENEPIFRQLNVTH